MKFILSFLVLLVSDCASTEVGSSIENPIEIQQGIDCAGFWVLSGVKGIYDDTYGQVDSDAAYQQMILNMDSTYLIIHGFGYEYGKWTAFEGKLKLQRDFLFNGEVNTYSQHTESLWKIISNDRDTLKLQSRGREPVTYNFVINRFNKI